MAFSIQHYFRPALLLGLDIAPEAVRMVELSQRPDRRFQLERYAQQALPAGTVSDQHIQHPGQLAEHIAALAQKLGSKQKRIALALPAHTVITRSMQVPANSTEQALNALITTEASAYLTVAPDQVRVDYQFSHANAEHPSQRSIVLAAARREQVEDRIAAVEAAGLIPDVLDIDLYAAHDAACVNTMHALVAPGPSALLMLGASLTQIALFDRHQLRYHRELPGCSTNSDPMQIAIAVIRAIQLATPADVALEHIFIGGDHDEKTQLAQLIHAQSNIPCSEAHPFDAMPVGSAIAEPTDDDAARRGSYLVACGLAMRNATR